MYIHIICIIIYLSACGQRRKRVYIENYLVNMTQMTVQESQPIELHHYFLPEQRLFDCL